MKKLIINRLLFSTVFLGFGFSSLAQNNSTSGMIINNDTFIWEETSKNRYYDLINNDVYNINDLTADFLLSSGNKNATISQVGNWPDGFKLDEKGFVIVEYGKSLPTQNLRYQICNTDGSCQEAIISFVVSSNTLFGNIDTILWPSNGGTFKLLENDYYLNQNNIKVPINSTNVTISKRGIWPEGIDINSSGELVISSSASIPTSRTLLYQICLNDGQCMVVPISFNQLNPGAIETNMGPVVCDGSLIEFSNDAIVVNIGELRYTWQVSYNNGLKWENLNNETLNGLDKLKLTVFEGNILVRRQIRQHFNILDRDDRFAFTEPISIKAIKNHIAIYGGNGRFLTKGETFTIPNITTTLPSEIEIRDRDNKLVNIGSSTTFTEAGTYIFTIKATTLDSAGTICPSYSSIIVEVLDMDACNTTQEKVFADKESDSWGTVPLLFIPLGGVGNTCFAADNDLSTYSTITVGVGALGLGTTWQNLYFNETVPKGTPVTIKLGQEYSGLQVAGGITVSPIYADGSTGYLQSVGDGALLDLLVGDNVFEYTFVPVSNDGENADFIGVRVTVGSLLAVSNNAKLFGAYYNKNVVSSTCDINNSNAIIYGAIEQKKCGEKGSPLTLNNTTSDITWGVEDIGLGVATSLASVVNPYYAVDNDVDSYAIFNKSVALLNRQNLTVNLKQIARPGDEIRILMGGFSVPLLDLKLISDFRVQRYLGDVKVGEPVTGDQLKFLDLDLFALNDNYGNRRTLVVNASSQPFDRIELSYLSVAEASVLGDFTYVYDISVEPRPVLQFDPLSTDEFCASDYLKIQKIDPCSTYKVEFAFGNFDSEGQLTGFTTITDSSLTEKFQSSKYSFFEFRKLYPQYEDNLYLKIQGVRNSCNVGSEQYFKINLKNCNAVVNPVLQLKTR